MCCREFYEETNVKSDCYRLYKNTIPIVEDMLELTMLDISTYII